MRKFLFTALLTFAAVGVLGAAATDPKIDPSFPKTDLVSNGDHIQIIGKGTQDDTIGIDLSKIAGTFPNKSVLVVTFFNDGAVVTNRVDINCTNHTFSVVDQAEIDPPDYKVAAASLNPHPAFEPVGGPSSISGAAELLSCTSVPFNPAPLVPRYDKNGDLNQPYQPKATI